LLNEYGGLIEKILENDTFAKIAGYLFKQLREFVVLFIPIDVINDYHKLLISFLEGLASDEIVDNIRQFSGKDDINYLFEGAQIALENLGIDQSMMEKTEENIPNLIKIMQEILMLFSDILTLPIRVLISEGHYGLKTAINSVVSEEEGLFGSIKDRIDTIFDYVQEIRK